MVVCLESVVVGSGGLLVLAMRRSSCSSFLVWGCVFPSAGKSVEVGLNVFCGFGGGGSDGWLMWLLL